MILWIFATTLNYFKIKGGHLKKKRALILYSCVKKKQQQMCSEALMTDEFISFMQIANGLL